MRITVSLILLLSLAPFCLQGQELSRKEASKAKVKSVSVFETNVSDKKAKPILESMNRYDESGNLLEILEKDKNGVVTLHESYEYNSEGQKSVEIQYEPDGKIKKKNVFKYSDGLRSERQTFDKNGALISQRKYVYEFNK
jgi:hypothetical protein